MSLTNSIAAATLRRTLSHCRLGTLEQMEIAFDAILEFSVPSLREAIGCPRVLSVAESQVLEVQFQQMFEIILELIFWEIGEKLRLGACVDLADAVYQFSFAHTKQPFHATGPLLANAISTSLASFL